MLTVIIPATTLYNEKTNRFIKFNGATIHLEHSLVSISKWESKWNRPFLSKKPMTVEETIDYVRCMSLDEDTDLDSYKYLTNENIEQISKYIEAPMTATWFSNERPNRASKETVTSELIYYWMVALTIPFECQYWHLNRLLTLIKVCNIKNQPPKKRSRQDIMRQYEAQNEARKRALKSRG